MSDPFEKLHDKILAEDDDFEPYIVIERVIVHEDQSGVTFYRVRYGSETIFIGSDDSIETATKIEDSKKEKILRRFKKYINSDEGKSDIAQVMEQQAKEQ